MSTNEKLMPGMVLGRYELLLPIAQGGMATVWAARQRGTRGFNKTVAIKTMLPTLSEDAQFEQMFLDEAALAAKIHHPNVAEILDLGEQDEVLYIVMEWVDGEALSVIHKAARKSQSQVPVRSSLKIVMQACAGLHAAHELRDENDVPLQLVHRDVSPQNVLCTYDGIVKLVDFGVAKAVGRGGGETNAGQLKGKVPYMSPEQARGGMVDRRTDIFAMGIVLYKLTTGLHPFLGENDLLTMRNIISRPLLPPRVKNPAFPEEVEQILIKCLQKDPDKRYQTMAELGAAVERAASGVPQAEDDIGGFVRGVMGDRGAKRRAAVRDAVRVADERYATGTHALVQLPTPQTVHESVSEIVPTKIGSGIKEDLLRPSSLSAAPPPSSSRWDGQPEPHGTTDQPVMVSSESLLPPRRSKAGLFVGVGVSVAAAVVGVVLFLRPGIIGAGGRSGANTTTRIAAADPGRPTTKDSAPVLTAATAHPEASGSASSTASAAPGTPAASGAPSGSAVSINSLPDAPEEVKKTAAVRVPGPLPQTPQVRTTPTPEPDKGDGKPTRKVSTDKVPIFTNPGF